MKKSMKRFVSAVVASSMAFTSMAVVNTSAVIADETVAADDEIEVLTGLTSDFAADDAGVTVYEDDNVTIVSGQKLTAKDAEAAVEVGGTTYTTLMTTNSKNSKVVLDSVGESKSYRVMYAITAKADADITFNHRVGAGKANYVFTSSDLVLGNYDDTFTGETLAAFDNTADDENNVYSSDTVGVSEGDTIYFAGQGTNTYLYDILVNGVSITESGSTGSEESSETTTEAEESSETTTEAEESSETTTAADDSTTTEATTESTTEATTESTTESTTVVPVEGAVNVSVKFFNESGEEISEALPGDTVIAKYYLSGLDKVEKTFSDGSTGYGFNNMSELLKFDSDVLEYVEPVVVDADERVRYSYAGEYETTYTDVVSASLIATQAALTPSPETAGNTAIYGTEIDGVKTAASIGVIKLGSMGQAGGTTLASLLQTASTDGTLCAVKFTVKGAVGTTGSTTLEPYGNGFVMTNADDKVCAATYAAGSISVVEELATTTTEATTETTTAADDTTTTTTEATTESTTEATTSSSSDSGDEDVTVIDEEISVSVKVGKTSSLYSKVLSEISASDYTWSSSNTKYVTVTSKGVIEGIKKGTAVVTATYSDDQYDLTYTFNVTVKSNSSSGGGSSSSSSSGATIGGTSSTKTTGGTSSSSGSNSNSSSSTASGFSVVSGKSFTTPSGVKITPPALADKEGNVYAGSAISGSKFSGNATFNDTSSVDSWAGSAIKKLAALGIISGTGNGNFSPMLSTKRGDFILMLVNTLGLEGTATDNFDDVDPAKYYANAIGLAKEAGIATGYGDGNFGPDNYITRQDVMVLVSKTLEFLGDTDMASETVLDQFADKNDVSSYAVPYVANLVSRGIVNGTDKGVEPKVNITRAQMAVLIANVYDTVVEMAEAANPTVEEETEETTEAEEDTTVDEEETTSDDETTTEEEETEETTEEEEETEETTEE